MAPFISCVAKHILGLLVDFEITSPSQDVRCDRNNYKLMEEQPTAVPLNKKALSVSEAANDSVQPITNADPAFHNQ